MNPTMAAIRDKDDAHPLGVVGWRSEYHAMRAALDAVLAALDAPDPIHAKCPPFDEHDDHVWLDEAQRRLEAVEAAITAHLDIESR